jgi:tRNA A-37 threonylcarbamoyl transferase component Bud32
MLFHFNMDPTIQSNGIISDNKTVNSKDTDDSKFLTLDSLIFDDSPPHITQIRPLTTHLYGNSAVASNKTSTGAISKTPASVEATQSLNSTAILEAELNGRYKVIEYISHGSYGVVYRAVDVQTNQHVAIKKAINIFDSSTTAKRLLREIKLLRMLKNHINIVKFIGVLAPVDPKTFNDLCLVFEYVDTDLQKLIQSNQHFGNLHIQYFLYQILCGISYIHSAGMLHRDVKPANILVNENCSLKLCDLGLARFAATSKPISNPIIAANTVQLTSAPMGQRELTKHVVTRWYRAPELVLLTDNYTPAIDMWVSIALLLTHFPDFYLLTPYVTL